MYGLIDGEDLSVDIMHDVVYDIRITRHIYIHMYKMLIMSCNI